LPSVQKPSAQTGAPSFAVSQTDDAAAPDGYDFDSRLRVGLPVAMDLQFGFERPAFYRGGFVSIGNFDGLHQGHQQIIRELVSRARECAAPGVVMTFDPPPLALLAPDRVPPRIMSIDQRAAQLRRMGVDCLIVYPTDQALLELTAEEFFQKIIRETLIARGLIEGPDFHFGKRRSGNIKVLFDLCKAAGMELDVVPPAVDATGQVISSTAIRQALREGRIGDVNAFLKTRLYEIEGTVVAGARRGRLLGFPTANLGSISGMLPLDGVYAAMGVLSDGRRFPAAVHIGPNSTFDESEKKVEAFLVGFASDLYGSKLRLEFVDRVRGTQKFDSVELLKKQMDADVARTVEVVKNESASEG
jgi:riboflavin kinase/FMN adenylyltransferase